MQGCESRAVDSFDRLDVLESRALLLQNTEPVISLDILLSATIETAKISIPAVWESTKGPLSTEYCDQKLQSWSQRLLDQAHATISVTGEEHLSRVGPTCVVMSNHQSLYDIPTWFASIPLSLRMAAKAELFRTPIWGPAMEAAGFIKIDRSNPEAARAALADAGQNMKKNGLSLCIAPEGTRSPDGRVGRFKRGGFEFAKTTGMPILPVAVEGTRHILGKGQRHVRRDQQVSVQILEPLLSPDFSDMDALRKSVRDQIAMAVDSARQF